MRVMAPILLLVVPIQAFMSMRQEVAAGTIEHLLLSRLTPSRIVRGKLYAAAVQSLVFFSLFAPLIALSYLLRGVDVPTIGLALGFAFLYALGASTLAVALGSLSRWPAFRVLPLLLAAVTLTLGAALVTGAMDEILRAVAFVSRSSTGRWQGLLSVAVIPAVGITLFSLVATAVLAHPCENRSTAFRVFAALLLPALVVWIAWTAAGTVSPFVRVSSVVSGTSALLALLLLPFWLFAATEDDRLSPRVRTLVPRNRLAASLSFPLLPGGARGVAWTYLLAGLGVLLVVLLPEWFGGRAEGRDVDRAVVAWSYAALYASLARGLRGLLGRTGRGPALTRLLFPLVVGVLSVLPTLIDVTLHGRSARWWGAHVLNPFTTIRHVHRGFADAVPALLVVAALGALAVQARAIARSAREVAQASRERRRRAA
jgi:hypothetical protein